MPPILTPDEAIKRYQLAKRVLDWLLVVLLAPFFVFLVWFLFRTDYAFHLVESREAAWAGFLLLVLFFGPFAMWAHSVPVVLRLVGLRCDVCGGPMDHAWVNRQLVVRAHGPPCNAVNG